MKNRVIGLDIGSSSIKLAEFLRRDGKLTLLKLKLREIAFGKDMQEARLDALKMLFQGINARQAKINVVINSPQSVTKILTIPYMPKSEIPLALRWEMKDFISFSIDEAALGCEVIREVTKEGIKKLEVAAACIPRQTVNKYLGLLNQAVAPPALFTQPAFAVKNVATSLFEQGDKAVAVLDIGYNFSELLIFEDRRLSFSRKLPVAGNNFTQDMRQTLVSDLGRTTLSEEEAEDIKKKYGIPESAPSQLIEGKLTCGQLIHLLRPNLEKLIEETGRSFGFYREKEQGADVGRLVLLGAGSSLKGLREKLAEELGIPVELGNPLKNFPEAASLLKDSPRSAHRFAQAIGAALSSQDEVNLLPEEIKEQTKLLVKRASVKALVTAVIVIVILSYIGMRIRLGVYDKGIAAATLELTALKSRVEEVRKQASLGGVLRRRVYWSDALKEIGNRIPRQIRLSELTAAKNRLTLKGRIKSSDLAEEKVLTEFMNSLEKGIFKEVNLISSKKGLSRDKPYTFELRLDIE